MRRGEVYYADLDPVVGSEQGGIRPVLIIQNDTGNEYSGTVIVAAITSSMKRNDLCTHVMVHEPLIRTSTVQLEQLRTIDKVRVKSLIGKLSDEDMEKIDRALEKSIGLGKKVKSVETAVKTPVPEVRKPSNGKRHIKEFSQHKVVFSDGTVITSDSGEFDHDIIKAILEAGD